jgi:hypothetical protein
MTDPTGKTDNDALRLAFDRLMLLRPKETREVVMFKRIDPVKNINRFYLVTVMPTLFGEWSLLRE